MIDSYQFGRHESTVSIIPEMDDVLVEPFLWEINEYTVNAVLKGFVYMIYVFR